MSSLPVFVGLDYHDQEVQVCVLDGQGNERANRGLPNDARRIHDFVARHGVVTRAGIEACCGAAHLADELAARFEWSIHLAHPGYVARMKQSPDKHDLGDSRLLADLTRVGYLPKVWLAPESTRQLRRLVRHRQQLVDARRDVKLRVRALLRENRFRPAEKINAWTKAWWAWARQLSWSENDRWLFDQHCANLESLTAQIRATEERLIAQTANDPLVQRLLTLDGVGWVTAVTLRAELGRSDRFRTGKQLARFCGVTPRNASSGQRQADAGLTRAGNPGLRRVLVELGQRLAWFGNGDSHWNRFAVRLLRQGKPRNVIVAAVANRWVRRLFYQLQTPWTENGKRSRLGLDKRGPPLAASALARPQRS